MTSESVKWWEAKDDLALPVASDEEGSPFWPVIKMADWNRPGLAWRDRPHP